MCSRVLCDGCALVTTGTEQVASQAAVEGNEGGICGIGTSHSLKALLAQQEHIRASGQCNTLTLRISSAIASKTLRIGHREDLVYILGSQVLSCTITLRLDLSGKITV